jgi:hypothetical protein
MWAKDDAKAVESPTIHMCVPEIVAMGTVMGPMAETVAPSLMKFVVIPVNRLEAMANPEPLRMNSGRMLKKASAK